MTGRSRMHRTWTSPVLNLYFLRSRREIGNQVYV